MNQFRCSFCYLIGIDILYRYAKYKKSQASFLRKMTKSSCLGKFGPKKGSKYMTKFINQNGVFTQTDTSDLIGPSLTGVQNSSGLKILDEQNLVTKSVGLVRQVDCE